MRPVTVLFCLGLCVGLGGCFAAGATGDLAPEITTATTPEPVVEPSPDPKPAPRAASKPQRTRTAAAAASAEKEEWWKEGGITREKINGMCWMKAEKAGRSVSADKKAEIVEKCVEETLKEYPID